MDLRARLVCAALIFTASTAAQDVSRFAGTWKGEHAGKPYLILSIAAGSPARITLKTSDIHVGESGEIDETEGPVENEERVVENWIAGAPDFVKPFRLTRS